MSSWLMAQTLVRTLIAEGITDAVLAPGSRNAALSILLDRAARSGQIRLHVRVDERSAGFLALGLGKASGRPAPVVCTSGTAAGNLLPAAMEARHAGVPWLALTCDRPAFRVGSGASQTTDQPGIFGVFAVASQRLSSSSGRPRHWAAGLRRTLGAARGTRTGRPGPAQLNVEFSEPLLAEPGHDEPAPPPAVALPGRGPGPAHALKAGPRSVVLAGDATPQTGARARAFAEAAGLPLLAEPSSNARGGANAISCYRLLLGAGLRPGIERVVTFGHPTLSRPVAALLSDPGVEHIVVAEHADWPDVGASASVVCDGVAWSGPPAGRDWLEGWRAQDRALRERLDAELTGLSGYTLAAEVVAATGAGENLVFGSSNPIRDADLAPIASAPATAWANRGLAGIDGTIATAVGIGLATDAPTTLLLGDLTFTHDLGSLAFPPGEPRPRLRIVVADDDGGSIFHTLEQGGPDYADSFERVFAVPHGLDLGAIAAGFGHPVTRVGRRGELRAALRRPIGGVEVVVVGIGRGERRATDAWLATLAG
ncbi:MAG: 2-succinyl-5-enolpyruvyl-6-hydroxy-3-cyclohexene-1-carboxylic-acid synthase [Propionibacteriaceae bacterium]|nr:2-succinyl-5-enolpyruvyl-6-hydroxy-3-cyclohexene-1-carboxylic-acid synthase [Propionibacteriaceae bacterium]